MSIIATEIKHMRSTDDIGGEETGTEISGSHFPAVTGDQRVSGYTDYVCFYLRNDNDSQSLFDAEVWLQSNTPSEDTHISIGLGVAAVGEEETPSADRTTAPAGVTFVDAANESNSLVIGDIGASQSKAVWLRRVVDANATAVSGDSFTVATKGDFAV